MSHESFKAVHKVACEYENKQSNTNSSDRRNKYRTCGNVLDFSDVGILLGGIKVAGFLNGGVDKLCRKNRTYCKNKNCPLGGGYFSYVSKEKYEKSRNKVKTHVAFGDESSRNSLECIFKASELTFHILVLVYCVT